MTFRGLDGYTGGIMKKPTFLLCMLGLLGGLATRSIAQVIIVRPGGGHQVVVQQQLPRREIEMSPAQAMGIIKGYAGIEAGKVDPKRIAGLIDQLGDRDWRRRKRATEELMVVGSEAVMALERAARNPDAEIAARARHILSRLQAQGGKEGLDLRQAVSVLAAENNNELPPLLLAAMEDARVNIRRAAGGSLRRVTGLDMGFYASDPEETRNQAIEKWKTWWAKSKENYAYDSDKESALLICDPSRRKILAMTVDAKLLWQRDMNGQAVAAVALPSGNLLVAYRGQSELVEVDPADKIVRRIGNKADIEGLFDFQLLPGGNVLLVDDPGGKVVEIDSEGKVVWQKQNLDHPHAAFRDARGNTVIAVHRGNEILTLDSQGKVVSRIENQRSISDVRPYRDGSRYLVSTRMGNQPKIALVDVKTGQDAVEIYEAGWPVTSSVVTAEGFVFAANQGDGVVRGAVGLKVVRTGIPRPDMWGKLRISPRSSVEKADPDRSK